MLAAPAATAAEIHLPTREDSIASGARVETLLNGKKALETLLPGPIRDRERVEVSFGPSGRPVGVELIQLLRLSGLGDFSFKVPGPAIDVEALPGSDERPGLRRGAILWQGFSPGLTKLDAVMHLDPALEAARLPLSVRLKMTVGGRPLRGEPLSGPLAMSLEVKNRSGVPVTMPNATSEPAATAAALDAVAEALVRRDRPVPGDGGLTESLPLVSQQGKRTEQIEAPFQVEGTIAFPPGTVTKLRTMGGAPRLRHDGRVAFSGELGGGNPLSLEVRVTGEAHDLRLPDLEMRANTAPPAPDALTPPGGGTWAAFAAAHPGEESSRMMVGLLLETLWQTARLTQFDGYLGNPYPTGPAHTDYMFRLTPPPARAEPAAFAEEGGVNPFGLLLVTLLGLLVLSGATVVWARS